MTPKQILDSFSETLMRDERILSARERALLANLLQHAKNAAGDNHHTHEAVRSVIATAVGETVAQRAFSVLGGSIVERILDGGAASLTEGISVHEEFMTQPDPPSTPLRTPGIVPPAPQPEPPSVRAPRKEPHHPMRDTPVPPSPQPEPPSVRSPRKDPQPPGHGPGRPMRDTPVPPSPQPEPPTHGVTTKVVARTGVATEEMPKNLPAQCVVLDEFLAPQEVDELIRFTLEHEADFHASEVISPHHEKGVVNYEHRRSRVLMDLGNHESVMFERIKSVLPEVLQKLGMEDFTIAEVETQITASNDGDYFHFHSDNGSDRVASRHLTFVYFFHREPRQFEGGELRIHDARLDNGSYVSQGSYQTIAPRQNQIVFFPCELMHEITPVECASQHFADSRFTMNGWLRQ
jgi:Rps23 Pro-64 3,4-dihydroxylase Tpa1-like proline 4-hydroxylase